MSSCALLSQKIFVLFGFGLSFSLLVLFCSYRSKGRIRKNVEEQEEYNREFATKGR